MLYLILLHWISSQRILPDLEIYLHFFRHSFFWPVCVAHVLGQFFYSASEHLRAQVYGKEINSFIFNREYAIQRAGDKDPGRIFSPSNIRNCRGRRKISLSGGNENERQLSDTSDPVGWVSESWRTDVFPNVEKVDSRATLSSTHDFCLTLPSHCRRHITELFGTASLVFLGSK